MAHNIPQKLRILALHGYMQSSEKFREKTYPFQRKVKKYADFVFITASHNIPNEFVDDGDPTIKYASDNSGENKEINLNTSGDGTSLDDSGFQEEIAGKVDLTAEQNTPNAKDTECYAWYKRRPNETNTGYIYTGIQETFDYLERFFEENGPFNGIFGFSQGGCVVGLLCDLQQRNLVSHVKFDFAIIASGFKHDADDFHHAKLDIPSLHIYGENDKQIPSEWSHNLIECFNNPVIAKHPGGHYIPGNNSLKKEYEMFFKEQWFKKFGIKELH